MLIAFHFHDKTPLAHFTFTSANCGIGIVKMQSLKLSSACPPEEPFSFSVFHRPEFSCWGQFRQFNQKPEKSILIENAKTLGNLQYFISGNWHMAIFGKCQAL
jgi:hypothetical protein